MRLITSHQILVNAPSMDSGIAQVKDFFNKTMLVKYDRIDVDKAKCFGGDKSIFQEALNNSIEANKKTLTGFVKEFDKSGTFRFTDLDKVQQGYPSKLLHIIAHFLDGFIGIDSVFYNLIEDSHWVSEETRGAIVRNPEKYQLIHLNCYSSTPEKVALVQH